ncbi:uncharacterized protein C17orf80 homolog [Anoplopoma fimbria]|uniref:uncharacterized protein C17orf80 homolog n=1 Tax=Anoplopoma fimbria TaxID=229290 RepID=UPI0023ED3BBF|nr:uncharacterized protein C17orf80 homolog [Anoplopoma fimbria]
MLHPAGMSSELCPFCGKTYKRLKSHLPHCKAAKNSKTPPTEHDVTVNRTSSSPPLAAALYERAAKSTETLSVTLSQQSKKSKKKSVVSAAAQTSSVDSASLPPATKKTKQKLSEQIKSANVSLTSSTSLPPSPAISKPKKQSLRALREAAKSEQVSQGTSDELPSGPATFVADPLSSRTTAETETKTNPDSVKDEVLPAFLSKSASKKTKKAAQSVPTTKDSSGSLDSKANESSANFWVEDNGEVEDLSVNKMLLKSGNGHQGRITLQSVKATLGRANANRRTGRPSILSQIETTENLSSKISQIPLLKGYKEDVGQLPCTSSQHAEKQGLMSKQASVSLLQQPELTSPAAPLLSGHLSSQVRKTTSPPHTVSRNQGQKVSGLLTISPSYAKFSRPLPEARVETWRGGDVLRSPLEVRNQNTADEGTKGAQTQRSLGQVRLRELPEWLACKTPSHPKDVAQMVQRGWQWYYKRYIDVKKGGAGGLCMLLAGYCVLSYIWSYPHIKRDRWRKYH